MSHITLKGQTMKVIDGFIKQGGILMNFTLNNDKLEEVTLENFKGLKKVIATIPSVDTPVCSKETVDINRLAKEYPSITFIIVSRDLPFAQARFCKNEALTNIILLSDMLWDSTFAHDYGVKIVSGPLTGLLARAIFVADAQDKVTYSELVEDLGNPPNFGFLKEALQKL